MKILFFRKSMILLFMVMLAGCSDFHTHEIEILKQKNADLNELAAPPPASLDSLFPPIAKYPVYLEEMLKLDGPFAGIGIDLSENDFENVTKDFNSFKAQFTGISKLVPEWEKYFPLELVDSLGTALETKDHNKIMSAYGAVGKICHDCHASFMAKVQERYHWQDFTTIKVHDSLTNKDLNFSEFKLNLSSALTGIAVDLQQGQIENAQKQFQEFNSRFQTLKTICWNCHQTPRMYFVDETVQSMIDKLGSAINEPDIDTKQIADLSQGIGMESCFRCHLVHVPAALAKFNWDKWEKINKK